jgi:RHS repeat-associated protein
MKRRTLIHKLFSLVAVVSMLLGSVQPVLAASQAQSQADESLSTQRDRHPDDAPLAPLPPQLTAPTKDTLPSPAIPRRVLEAPQPPSPGADSPLSPRRQAQAGTHPLADLPSFAWGATWGDISFPDPLASLHPVARADYEQNRSELASREGGEEIAATSLASARLPRPWTNLETISVSSPVSLPAAHPDYSSTGHTPASEGIAVAPETTDKLPKLIPLRQSANNWAVGNTVYLCAGTQIRYGPGFGFDVHTTVPEDNWTVVVIDGPRYVDGQIWWDIDRSAAGDLSGGTGWVYQSQADSCLSGGLHWVVGEIVGLCEGTEIRHGPGLAVHTVVPEDDWAVMVINGPRIFDGQVWWDTSRAAAGDPSGGTGWVSQQQAEASCGGGGGGGYTGPLPLSPELRALLRALGYWPWSHFSGDPVNVTTGSLTQQFTDLSVPGVAGFDFILQRTYNSLDERDGVFGFGWSSLLDMSLRLANDGSIDVRYPDGHGVYFIVDGDAYVPGQDGVFDTLTYDGSGFELTPPDQVSYLFDDKGHLTAIHDRHNNTITLERDGDGHVNHIFDSGGRAFDLTYDADHIASISDPLGRTISYEYDNGDLVSVTDGNGGTHRFDYEDHRMIWLTDPEGILYLQNIYDDERRVIEQLDASGSHSYLNYDTEGETLFTDNLSNQTRYGYDDLLRVTEVQDALGHVERYEYDDDYNVIAYTDKRGNTWSYTYDDWGNMLSETDPLGNVTTHTYNETNDLTSTTDALERTTTQVWEDGNLTRLERPSSTAFAYTYDDHGQMLTATDPNGHTNIYTYDQYGNLVEVHSPLGCATSYEYDIVGRMTSMTDANDHTAGFEYDANDNIVRIVDPRGHPTQFVYNGNDLLIRMVDRRGGAWLYEYDDNLKLAAETDPMEHTTRHTYDAMYNRVSTTDPRGNTTLFRYDPLYRLVEVEDALGNVTRYEYDAHGNLIKITDALDQETELEYDELNRLVGVTDTLAGETRYGYDAVGHLVRVVNPRQAPTRYEYDEVDRLTRVIDALDGVTEYEYDDADNLVAITDANRHTTHFTYDVDDRMIAQEDPEGHAITYGYDCVGNLVRLVDGRGNPTTFGYDENDNLVWIKDALDGRTTYAYDEEDARISATDPNGNTTQFAYNLDGLPVELTEAGGQVTRFEYDEAHNLVELTNARENATRFEYDELNRLIAETDPLMHTTHYAYDALGRRIAVTDANLIVTRYEYDPLDRLTAVVQNYQPDLPADHQTNVRTGYSYDEVGNLLVITDANQNETHFEYDLLDRLITEINPLDNVWRYEYDPMGNLVQRLDANQAATYYTYNADDLLVGIHYPDGGGVSFSYDEAHNQVTMSDSLGGTTNVYDKLNRLTSSTNHQGQVVGYAYDPASNRVALTYPDGRMVRYEVDTNNRVSRVIDPDGGIFRAEYDPIHNLTAIHYPNQTQALMTYDAADRLTSLVNQQNDGDVISSFAYTLDAVGNRVHVDEYYRWRQPHELSQDYTYDPLYRLARSQDSEGRFTEYGYDAVGNRLSLTSNYDPLRTPTDVRPYSVASTYNAANQLLAADHSVFGATTYSYDANGNRVRREGPDTSTGDKKDVLRTDYTYDYENRLIQVNDLRDPGNGKWQARGETSMLYDGYGRLFRRSQAVHPDASALTYKVYLPGISRGESGDGGQKWLGFVYDGLDPIAEYGEPNPNHYVNYYRGLGRILEMHEFKSQQSPQGTAYYFHHDGLGSVSALTKHNGQSAHTYRYWDFGVVLDKNGRAADASNFTDPHNHYTFTGQEWEEHTRLYHFYAREYDPLVGVWLQQDRFRGLLAESRTLHRYVYVGDNPIGYIDEYGHVWHIVAGIAGGMLVGGGVEIVSQAVKNIAAGKSMFDVRNYDLREVGAAALGGAVSGGLAAAAAPYIASAAIARSIAPVAIGAIGGAFQSGARGLFDEEGPRLPTIEELAWDVGAGAVGGYLGAKLLNTVPKPVGHNLPSNPHLRPFTRMFGPRAIRDIWGDALVGGGMTFYANIAEEFLQAGWGMYKLNRDRTRYLPRPIQVHQDGYSGHKRSSMDMYNDYFRRLYKSPAEMGPYSRKLN